MLVMTRATTPAVNHLERMAIRKNEALPNAYSEIGLKSAVRVQRQRGAKQHAGDDQSDYASSEPSGTHGHPEERSLAKRVLRDRAKVSGARTTPARRQTTCW